MTLMDFRTSNRYVAHSCLLLGLVLAATASLAFAARPVDVYEVSVRGAPAGETLREAMRETLVRATGRRDAASNPAFAPLVAHAAQYVRSTRSLGDDAIQVTFDGAALQQQIIAAGGRVWDEQRPFTIIVLSPPPTGPAGDEARQSLEEIAEGRGLPVTLVPMAIVDASGNPLTSDMLLTNAQRLGGDAMLLGRAEPASGAWQWTLLAGFSTTSWSGSFADGINGAADALSAVQGNGAALAEEDAVVEVTGVATLADYASIERMLSELPGVQRSGLEEADGTTARFDVLILGGAQAIERALAHSPHLAPAGATGASLTYQFHP